MCSWVNWNIKTCLMVASKSAHGLANISDIATWSAKMKLHTWCRNDEALDSGHQWADYFPTIGELYLYHGNGPFILETRRRRSHTWHFIPKKERIQGEEKCAAYVRAKPVNPEIRQQFSFFFLVSFFSLVTWSDFFHLPGPCPKFSTPHDKENIGLKSPQIFFMPSKNGNFPP